MNMMITMKLSQTETLKTLNDHIDNDLSGFFTEWKRSFNLEEKAFHEVFLTSKFVEKSFKKNFLLKSS